MERRLLRSIAEADGVYERHQAFLKTLFTNSLRQATSIGCAVGRIRQLTDRERPAPEAEATHLSALLGKGPFVTLTADRSCRHTGGYCYSSSEVDGIVIHVPASDSYKSVSKFLLRRGYSFQECGDDFTKPIPNGKDARTIDSRSLAESVAKARAQLKGYAARAPLIEKRASQALGMTRKLKTLLADLEVHLQDPTQVESQIAAYRRTLNQAGVALQDAKRAMRTSPAVTAKEVDNILRTIQ